MNRFVPIAVLVGGVVLLVLGINAIDSFSSDVSRFFTGSPTDKAVWMLIGGIVAAMSEKLSEMYGKPWINLTYDGNMETNNLERINNFAEVIKFCSSQRDNELPRSRAARYHL